MNRLDAARGVRLGLLSPDAIRAGSAGEVTRAETVRPADLAPVAGGLFAEAIFGPRWAWRCACGGPARPAPTDGRQRCGACGATVARNPERAERFGHVELAVACAHPWFARGGGGAPGDLATLLDLPQRALDRVLAYAAPLVVAVDEPTRARALGELTAALREARAAGAGRARAGGAGRAAGEGARAAAGARPERRRDRRAGRLAGPDRDRDRRAGAAGRPRRPRPRRAGRRAGPGRRRWGRSGPAAGAAGAAGGRPARQRPAPGVGGPDRAAGACRPTCARSSSGPTAA